ncbi:hypothetical protein BCR34DRAFT_555987 [Clohesyomyces aquaticus]|uniref:Gamma-glutamylcyclotransferase AIG2-like domain-containing protein n=1 Tax=Clohesyomyces aquaticus TaxID=1231657 RepID=A0A1Y2A4Y2_9PLEO|nr:hypothetical protein BCR34DRAFT_555987 [Clohesyomyces aquaticus]
MSLPMLLLLPFAAVLKLFHLPLVYFASHKPATMTSASSAKNKIPQEDLRLYSLALNNRWKKAELYPLITPQLPIFVHCPLVFPWVTAAVLGSRAIEDVEWMASQMTRATLRNYFRVTIKYMNRPTILHTDKEAAVDGILIGGLTEYAAGQIEAYIGLEHHTTEIEEVEVELANGEKTTVGANVYVWCGPRSLLEAKHWTPLYYIRRSLPPPTPTQ